MNETQVTLSGWLGGEVTTRLAGDATVASFRLAATPRRFNPRTEEWFDADTQWYSVNAWRTLAGNCATSLHRGDPVVVHGKLSARTWTNAAGAEVTGFEIEASFVGHDLNRGTSSFSRTARAETTSPAADVDAPDLDVAVVAVGSEVQEEAA